MSIPELTPTLLSAGHGRPVLVAGAGLGTGVRALWDDAVPFLPDFQVVGIDLPGHGASPAAEDPFSVAELAAAVARVVSTLRAAGDIPAAGSIYFAGVSLAGGVALQLGLDYPALFSGLAAICTGARIGEPQAWLDRADTVRTQGTPTQITGSAQRWFAAGFIDAHPEASARLLHTLQDADRFSYAHACEALAGFDVRDSLGRIELPLLGIAGGQDSVCPPAMAEAIAVGVRHGRCAVVESAAHQAPLEAPAETAGLLTDFFTSL
ncbi:alpha/beta fold hydrolase [Specibacter cremeus]|uniref:alpha/beta fold hydrolase n=1 Tax=Specibacter cremeus TaxID=1629051 RepID=UPI000F7B0732|nr:alpha/beta hydrolase [Specibacter cremeus]